MDRRQSVAEFDIVKVAPSVDLVLFDNVISCYPCDKDITANYVLGNNVSPSAWDWIGIFRVDWRYVGDYLAYCWAQTRAFDCTAPRRRVVVFPRLFHRIAPNDQDVYQFIYVTGSNLVVGVSTGFKITEEPETPDFNIAMLFKVPSLTGLLVKPRMRKAPSPIFDDYEVVNELPCPSLPKKHARRKQKMTTVYRDPDTLVNIASIDWASRFNIVQTNSIVREFNLGTQTPSQSCQEIQVYNVRWARNKFQNPVASIEFPVLQALKAGPVSFMVSLRETGTSCSNCLVAKTLVQDLVHKEAENEQKMVELKNKMESMSMEKTHSTSDDHVTAVSLLDWAFNQVQMDNQILKEKVDYLTELLSKSRAMQEEKPKTNNVLVETVTPEADTGNWIKKDPKRIARIKKVVRRQSQTLQILRELSETRARQVTKLQEENKRLRRLVTNAFDVSEKFRELAEEMNVRIRAVLAKRAKDNTNEWKQSTSQENTTQTPDTEKDDTCKQKPQESSSSDASTSSSSETGGLVPKQRIKNKQISKVLKSEKQQRPKLHKERTEAEKCPTCGIKFPRKVDRRVIEEHLVFHDRMKC